jgi:hypothetical protein
MRSGCHPEPSLTNSSQEALQREAYFCAHITRQQLNTKWIEGVDVALKISGWEVGIRLKNINHHWAPCGYVACLSLFV